MNDILTKMGITKTSNDFSKLVYTQRGLPNYKFPDQTFKNYKTVNVMDGKYPIDMLLKVLDPNFQVVSSTTNSDSESAATVKNAIIIPLNKEIVSSIFEYFKAMYNTSSNWAETENAKSNKLENLPVTTLKDFDPEIVVEFFTGVFKDQLNVTSKNCIQIYELANYLNDNYGKEHISKVITENLSQENVVDVYLKIEIKLNKNLGCLEWIKDNVNNINSNLENANKFYESLSRENFKVIWDLFNKCGLDCLFLKKFLTGWIHDSFKQVTKLRKTYIDLSIETDFEILSDHKSDTDQEIEYNEMNEITNFKIFPLLTEIDLSKILKAEDFENDRLKFFRSFQKAIISDSDFRKVHRLIIGEDQDKCDEITDGFDGMNVMDLKRKSKILDKLAIEKYPLPRDTSSFIFTCSYEDKLKFMMMNASYDKKALEITDVDGKLRIRRINDTKIGNVIFPTSGIKSYTVKNVSLRDELLSESQIGWTEHSSKTRINSEKADEINKHDKEVHVQLTFVVKKYFDKNIKLDQLGYFHYDKKRKDYHSLKDRYDTKSIRTGVKWRLVNDQITTKKEGVNLSWSNGSEDITYKASKFGFSDVSKLYPVMSLYKSTDEIEISNVEFE